MDFESKGLNPTAVECVRDAVLRLMRIYCRKVHGREINMAAQKCAEHIRAWQPPVADLGEPAELDGEPDSNRATVAQ